MTTTNMTPERLAEELKPCPFCGGTVLYFRGRGSGQVTCRICGAEGPETYTQEFAEEYWNSRPAEKDLLAEVKALREENENIAKEHKRELALAIDDYYNAWAKQQVEMEQLKKQLTQAEAERDVLIDIGGEWADPAHSPIEPGK